MNGATRAHRLPRACDECQVRKARCDRASPCSSCRAAGLTCRTTQKVQRQKDVIKAAERYETRVNQIEARLARVEQLLERSQSALTAMPLEKAPSIALSSENITQISSPSVTARETYTGNGNTGTGAESEAAKNIIDSTISGDIAMQQDKHLITALQKLRHVVARGQNDAASQFADIGPVQNTEPPTYEALRPVLQRLKESHSSAFDWYSPEMTMRAIGNFRDMIRLSTIQKVWTYAVIGHACIKVASYVSEPDASHFFQLSKLFADLSLRAVETLPLLVPPSLEAAEALQAAATVAITKCNPSLASSLCAAAARMCQCLGYHRLDAENALDPFHPRKMSLFWMLYILDRNTATRVGKPPSMAEENISTPMIKPGPWCSPTFVAMLTFWAGIARIQGRMIPILFGPSTSSLTDEQETQHALGFCLELDAVYQRRIEANTSLALSLDNSAGGMLITGEKMLYLGTVTMALSAISANHPQHIRALEAARQYLKTAQDIQQKFCNISKYTWTGYCCWLLLHGPLTPFMIAVRNVIANPDATDDLDLIHGYVKSLEPAAGVSDGVQKFLQLCSIFATVTQAYVDAKRQSGGDGLQQHARPPPSMNDFDQQLLALGLLGPREPESSVVNDSGPITTAASWYPDDFVLYDLLNQDLDAIERMM